METADYTEDSVDDITFLTLAEAIEIHRDQIERYGGHAGIRDLLIPGISHSAKFKHGKRPPVEPWPLLQE